MERWASALSIRNVALTFAALAAIAAAGTSSSSAFAQADDDDAPASAARAQAGRTASAAAVDRALHRVYPGGRDEQDLKVQGALPAPSRGADGGGAPAGVGRASAPVED